MSGSTIRAPDDWRNFSTHFPITACRLKASDLKLLYLIINERQREYGKRVVFEQVQQSNENMEGFANRKSIVSEAFITSVTITTRNGETLTANNERIFDEASFPKELRSIFYSTISIPSAILKIAPQDRIVLFLDFSFPPAIDFTRMPTFATPNESNFEVGAANEAWFVLSKDRLEKFFRERRGGPDWIHAAGAYDALLFLVGFPLGVWGCAKLESIVPSIDNLNAIPRSLVYGYVFLATLFGFRAMFSYSRWLFPKIEIETPTRRSPLRHRAAWAAALAALFWPALYEILKAIVTRS